jgi:hypothetical protein
MTNPINEGTLIVIDTQHGPGLGSSRLNIIAAGPLSKQPGSTPYRIVLIAYDNGEYSVHHQMFREDDLGKLKAGEPVSSSLAHGSYFRSGGEELARATKKFADKVSAHADYLPSLFRVKGQPVEV